MSPYRQPGCFDRRHAVLAEARRVRDALATIPTVYNIGGTVGSSREIVDALTSCIRELTASIEDMPPEVPF